MELLLDRDIRTTNSTSGKLFIDGLFECFILEDEDRGLKSSMPLSEIQQRKLKGNTAIPEGRYQVTINYSPHFDRELPLLLNVPGYEGIRIHSGNTTADTDGCLLTGVARSADYVVSSRMAFDKVYSKISRAISNNEKVFITIQL